MSRERSFKLAFIGSHGVGKTTLCYGLAARLKARDIHLEMVREVARRCPLPINQDTNLAAQSWILHTQIAEELAAQSEYDAVLCDRSVLDNYAYLLLAAGSQPALEGMVNSWMTSYDLLLHVPIVEAPSADGLRATDPTFQAAVEERLRMEIARRGLVVHELCAAKRDGWLDSAEKLVNDALRPPQLQLL
jgi:nicotinamide riboside kinase